MLAQGLVLLAGVLTAALVAALAGPPIFHSHLLEAGQAPDPAQLDHIEEAYVSASTIALGTALAIALTAAGFVTWYIARRMTRPLEQLAAVARRLSDGDYAARAPRFGAGPEISALTTTINDVAARLQTTEDTRRRLLADLAHELRTPLATIGAYLDGLDDGVTAWTPQTSRVLRDQAERLGRLAEDLAEVSRAEEGHLGLDLAPTRVSELVSASAQGVQAGYAAQGVQLRVLGPADDGGDVAAAVVTVDRDRILQVLTNLLTNALRHTPAGATVTVGAAVTSRAVTITVTDPGEGISPEALPHVFERFYRADAARDRQSGGSGIGLTIARAIAVAHGGTLEAASGGPGLGATFTLTLPR